MNHRPVRKSFRSFNSTKFNDQHVRSKWELQNHSSNEIEFSKNPLGASRAEPNFDSQDNRDAKNINKQVYLVAAPGYLKAGSGNTGGGTTKGCFTNSGSLNSPIISSNNIMFTDSITTSNRLDSKDFNSVTYVLNNIPLSSSEPTGLDSILKEINSSSQGSIVLNEINSSPQGSKVLNEINSSPQGSIGLKEINDSSRESAGLKEINDSSQESTGLDIISSQARLIVNREDVEVTPLSKYTVNSAIKYDKATITDLIATTTDIYILASTNDTYFIKILTIPVVKVDPFLDEPHTNLAKSSVIILGIFKEPLTNIGNIVIRNNHIIVLLYHTGNFIVTGNRPSISNQNGIVFNISLNDHKIKSFRNIQLTHRFLIFGGLEETVGLMTREEALYLLDDIHVNTEVKQIKLQKFNPMGSPSWNKHVEDGIISACTVKELILLLRCNSLEAIESNTGLHLWTTHIRQSAKCCIGKDSTVYITSFFSNVVTVIRANVAKQSFTIISENTFVVPYNPEIYSISTFGDSKYITSSEHEIRIYNDSNSLLSKIPIGNIDLSRTYRLIPKHVNSYILVALNVINTVNIDNLIKFMGTDIYSVTFFLDTL